MLVVSALFSGCSVALKLGYNQGPSLAFRLVDSYVDFDDAQSLRVRNGLADWFAWHRRTQLPDYADLLARMQEELPAAATPARMCAWNGELRARFYTAAERVAPLIGEVMPTLSAAQIAHLEKRYGAKNKEYRDDFLHRDPVKRRQAAVEREIERAEDFYGRLDDAQREFVAQTVAESPWDGDLAYTERLRRQQDVLTVLRRLTANRSEASEGEAEFRAYLKRLERSPHEPYRRHAARMIEFNCGFAASLHNLTSAEQRKLAVRKLKGYEDDLRALAADAAS